MRVVSWNIEGLTDAKLVTLQRYMVQYRISILCVQETHKAESAYFTTADQFLIVLSGSAGLTREFAGVGFIVAPWARQSLISFKQISNRLASVKVRVEGGKAVFFSAYAPQSGRPFDERQAFFQMVADAYEKTSSHGPKIMLGDWNAKLYTQLPNEGEVVGPHVFRNDAAAIPTDANRHLLLELCGGQGGVVANTFWHKDNENTVTCYNIGHQAGDPIRWESHSQIDFALCPMEWMHTVADVFSNRSLALATHHFPVFLDTSIVVPRPVAACHRRANVAALSEPVVANRFAFLFYTCMEDSPAGGSSDLNQTYACMIDAFQAAAEHALPTSKAAPKRPWISGRTLLLIDERCEARRDNNTRLQRKLNTSIQKSVKFDRTAWMDSLLADGDWAQMRKLKKGFSPSQGRMRNADGELVESDRRAETLAHHLEAVQWTERQTSAPKHHELINPLLGIDLGDITDEEVEAAARKLRNGHACGPDAIPGEFWKAVLAAGSRAKPWACQFCRLCWQQKMVPEIWHKARVTALFKKGDPAECDNHRPVSFLQVGYKLFAQILLARLQDGGSDDFLWKTQFGFRRGRGTNDALFVARRAMERTRASRDGRLVILALDWAKAFDSMSSEALGSALRRFGIPDGFVSIVQAIFSNRQFLVRDAGHTSAWHSQAFGISQGCPLSPYLFVILMTVLLHDAKGQLCNTPGTKLSDECLVSELAYADDIMLMDIRADTLQSFMACIVEAGREYGLELNLSKLEVLPLRTSADIRNPANELVKQKESIAYLGCVLSADGRYSSELSRRIGTAAADFKKLQRVWSHSNLTLRRKVRIFDACVVTRALCGLTTVCLNQTERKRLDGFQARCLRQILKIAPSYYSRVSNCNVLLRAHSRPLSQQMLEQQLIYFGKVALRSEEDPTRQHLFEPGSLEPRRLHGTRRVGRPRLEWTTQIHGKAVEVAGCKENLQNLLRVATNIGVWKSAVYEYFGR